MSAASSPEPLESIAVVAARIREAAPIRGDRATDEDCRLRRQLIDEALETRDISAGARVWHTAQLVDGRIVGVWADSPEEAELDLSVWWAIACHWVVPDPDCRIRDEYFPHGKTSANVADRRFPLTSPRSPRDRFAPAASLLDGLADSASLTGRG
jgi:hypothetical protein